MSSKQGRLGSLRCESTVTRLSICFRLRGAGDANKQTEKRQGNLNHFCMVVAQQDFSGIVGYLAQYGIPVREGPVSRWGARGRATSVYFLDPDGNEVEIRCY